MGASDPVPTAAKAADVDGLTARPDGNNVSMDREALQLAKTQLEFRTGVSLLRSEYESNSKVVHVADDMYSQINGMVR